MPDPSPAPAAPWAVPDSRIDEPAPMVVAVPGQAPARAETRPAAPAVPVPLRPMSTSDRIDGALRILKLAPATVTALAAIAVIPVHVVAALVLGGQPGLGGADEQYVAVFGRPLVSVFVDDTGGEILIGAALLVLEVLAVSVVAAGIGHLLTGWYLGRQPDTAEVLGVVGRRLPALAGAWLLVHLVEAAFAVAFLAPALLPMTWFAVVAPVIGIEGAGPIQAMRRSFRLARRALSTVAGTCLLVALVDLLLRFALTALGQLYLDAGLPAGSAVAAAVGIGARLVTVPFVAGTAALLYLDLRVRLEGLDIELAAVEGFPVAR